MGDQQTEHNHKNATDHRVTKLEEHAAFSEHTIEQLSAEITELNRRCRSLTDRLASLEQRLGSLFEDDGEKEG